LEEWPPRKIRMRSKIEKKEKAAADKKKKIFLNVIMMMGTKLPKILLTMPKVQKNVITSP
jgi:hypothetical protein